jgi:glycosyltransferase involved in cell wall biosynthesis
VAAEPGRLAPTRRCVLLPRGVFVYPLLRRIPTAVTLHDATAENHPDLIFPRFRSRLFWNLKTRMALRQADRIVTVSASARAQIAATFGLGPDWIAIISEGPSDLFRPLENRQAIAPILDRYEIPADARLLLYVGGISPHKNLAALLQALALLKQEVVGKWRLVLVGDYQNDSFHGCYAEVKALSVSLGLQNQVCFTGFVPDEQLVCLYNAATLLVLPSVSEGFGLPVVEAMSCGLPVAASNCGSLPEILGDAGVFFDPHSPSEMASALSRLLAEDDLRRRLREAGLQRVRQYSWRKAAADAVNLFQEMCHGRTQAA